jgi:hypothetical protein
MTFRWGQDDRGNNGWIPKGYPHFDAVAPGQFAHDCLEHFPRGLKHGQIADELLALGARLYIRVKSEWWWTQSFRINPPDQWAAELELLMREMRDGGAAAPAVITEPLLDDDMDDEIEAAVSKAVRVANRELAYQGSYDDHGHPDYEVESELMQSMAAWVRRGYRACVARFKGRAAYDVMWLGQQLDEAVARYSRGDEGDELIVRIHEKDMEYHITHKPTRCSDYY